MSLKIALLGYGKMGKELAQVAVESGHQIVATFEIDEPLALANAPAAVDVFIDFTHPNSVVGNVNAVAQLGKPLVIGTTGWYDKLPEVEKVVRSAKIGVIYGSNFSIGMNLFFKIVENAATLFDKFEQYDPFIHEWHHRGKVDSPSGTALTLGKIILSQVKRKKALLSKTSEEKIKPELLHVTSTRAGRIPGTHLVGFDSEADTVELKHTARGRRGFATGALLAAQWIIGKQGLFTISDMMNDLISGLSKKS
jgi:4-hydroxy-tetrahydrodipicolinate reductase